MKVVYCRMCEDLLMHIPTTPISCKCGHVAAQYWEDCCKMTVAVAWSPSCVAVYGINTTWHHFTAFLYQLKQTKPISYYLCLPFTSIFKLWLWARINGRICWKKPLEQAICKTHIGGVTFYTYD